jgi:hypothetical protein
VSELYPIKRIVFYGPTPDGQHVAVTIGDETREQTVVVSRDTLRNFFTFWKTVEEETGFVVRPKTGLPRDEIENRWRRHADQELHKIDSAN